MTGYNIGHRSHSEMRKCLIFVFMQKKGVERIQQKAAAQSWMSWWITGNQFLLFMFKTMCMKLCYREYGLGIWTRRTM